MRAPTTGLDRVLPRYDVVERHRRLVPAPPDATFQAFRELTPAEIPLATALFAVRSLPSRVLRRPGLPVRLHEPMLDQFLEAGFVVLDHRPGQEIVVGAIGRMWTPRGGAVRPDDADAFLAFDRPGFAKAAMSFTVVEAAAGTLAVTETRVLTTDAAARRAFRRYWRVIRPFSGLVRRAWLRGVAARVTTAGPEPTGGRR